MLLFRAPPPAATRVPRPHGRARDAGGRRPGAVPAAGAPRPRVVQAGGGAGLLLRGPRRGAVVRLPQVAVRAALRALRGHGTPGTGRRLPGAAPQPAEPREYWALEGAGRGALEGTGAPSSSPRPQAVCVEDVTPNLQSCERLPDGRAIFQCKADVFLSLRAADCRST